MSITVTIILSQAMRGIHKTGYVEISKGYAEIGRRGMLKSARGTLKSAAQRTRRELKYNEQKKNTKEYDIDNFARVTRTSACMT